MNQEPQNRENREEKMTPKKKEERPMFFMLKVKLEGISFQEGIIITIPISSTSRTIIGRDKIISTYKILGTQLEAFLEENSEIFLKKFNPSNFVI